MSETQNEWLIRVLSVDPVIFTSPGPTASANGTGPGTGGMDEATAAAGRAASDVPASAKGAVAYAKSRLAWLGLRTRVDAEISAFIESVSEQYEDDGNDVAVREMLHDRIGSVMATFDDTLADTLDSAANEADPARREELVAKARATIAGYQSYVASDDILAAMDSNPFASTNVQKAMTATLQELSAALR